MAFIRHPIARLAILTLVSALASAQDASKPFDCHITIGDVKYDLTSLEGEHTVSRELSVPPTTIEDKVTFNLCKDLERKSDVPTEDQVHTILTSSQSRTEAVDGGAH